MIRSRGTLSPNFDERSTANSTCVQSTHQLTYFWFLFFSSELSRTKHLTWPTWQFTVFGSRAKVNRCKRTKRTPLSHIAQLDSDEAGRGECYKHPQRLKVIKHRMFSYRKRGTIKPTVTRSVAFCRIFLFKQIVQYSDGRVCCWLCSELLSWELKTLILRFLRCCLNIEVLFNG